jgi:DNA-binding response OmpR family regulator
LKEKLMQTEVDAVASAEGARVLLAEDDAELRSLLADALRAQGYQVVELGDGEALLEFVARRLRSNGSIQGVDVLVSDIKMPGFSGMDVLVGLRRVADTTPVILITAFGDETTHELAHAFGAVAVLNKPFDVRHLTDTVLRSIVKH